jgi:rubrerythrin
MSTTTYYGFICPKCKSTVDIGIGEPNCPICGIKMVSNKQGKPIAMNVYCKKCNSNFGMINSDKCPICGTRFE